jgi:cytochrome c oxidase assembly protein Cox11
MNPKLRITLQIIAAFFVILFLIQPYNWFCQLSQSCKPFYLSYYLPKREGTKNINIDFSAENYRRDVTFTPDKPSLTTVSGRKNVVIYTIRNSSKKFIKVRPKMIIEPKEVEDFIIRHECLCFKQYTIKAGGSLELRLEFELDKKIETHEFENRIREKGFEIRFKI